MRKLSIMKIKLKYKYEKHIKVESVTKAKEYNDTLGEVLNL